MSNTIKMDRLPQIPISPGESDTVTVFRNVFQENIEDDIFPLDIAENIEKYVVDDELSLKDTAHNVLEIHQEFATESNNILETETEIIKEHGEYLCNKYLIDQSIFLRELSKLKQCDIFTKINLDDVEKYSLIQKCDLYPDLTRQFLDFHFNKSIHKCKNCFPVPDPEKKVFKRKLRSIKQGTQKLDEEFSSPKDYVFLQPAELIFSNFEIGKVYEQKVKIMNTSPQIQTVTLKAPPKLPVFYLKFESQKIACGMSATATIQFTPEVKLNLKDEVIFKIRKGAELKLPLKCQRKPPQLIGYVCKSNCPPNLTTDQHIPGSRRFSRQRRCAVNDTIDCGSCFVTDYVIVNLLLTNQGTDAKFFWISEEDFYYEKISTAMELCREGFWIYPTYFEISKEETSEIHIIFQPMYCGLHTQTSFIMCDNNSYKQIEIVADSICFNRKMISVDVPNLAKDIDKKEGHCIFLGDATDKEFMRFTLSITNNSSIFLKNEFKFETEDNKYDMSKWIQITNKTPVLAPYSVTDVIFHVKPEINLDSGYYRTALRLFMKDIPIASLNEEETFLVTTNNSSLEELVKKLSVVDVLVMDITVACYLNWKPREIIPEQHDKCERCGIERCSCKSCQEDIPLAELVFSESLIDLGVLPTGVNLKKDIYIWNLGKKKVTWKIAEIKYNMSRSTCPYVELIGENNMSDTFGKLLPGKKRKISYNIIKKQPTRWVSILVLFSVSTDKNFKEHQKDNYNLVAESICVITYEIVYLNINIKTGPSKVPILCPLQMLYTCVPFKLSLEIQNYSLISGCFYFLPPIGQDAEKVKVEYKPQFAELKPLSKKTVTLKVACTDVGILEHILLPCFVGKGQEPILVRLLCVVDCLHVFFYLPNKSKEYEKILWPPKILYEYDKSWSQYCMCEELYEEYENIVHNVQSQNAIQIMEKSSKTLSDIKTSKSEVNDQTKFDNDSNQDLLKTIVNVDSEICLQECTMQVESVPIKQPRKIKIYIENVTPKSAKYSIQATNFAARENFTEDDMLTMYKTTEEVWEPMIEKYGILVHPETGSGLLNPHELLSANIWIYANTWGIYTEEIVVDIEDIACFTFSMIIEVVGCPIHIPFSTGAITKYPTVRFGPVAVGNDNITKNIVMLNTSSVDLKISWHFFYCFDQEEEEENMAPFNLICDVIQRSQEILEFDFTEKFFGSEGADCIEIIPSQFDFSTNSKTTVPITFKPSGLKHNDQKCFMRCYILGRIFISEEDRLKSSYFYRKTNSLVLEATASFENPRLNIIVEGENNTLYLYANEVTLNRDAQFYMTLVARNSTSSTVEAKLHCSELFKFETKHYKINLNPGQCKKIKLLCLLSYEKIVKWSAEVYNLAETKSFDQSNSYSEVSEVEEKEHEKKTLQFKEKEVDTILKILTLNKKLSIHYKRGMKDVIPLNVCIYYPNIAVKPIHVKFGYVLIGRTQKTSVTVFNLTGYRILIEILKSTSGQEIVVTPCHGEIEKSTGMNHSFVNVTIYFTPTECKNYKESIRICTNIPQYHIDIPIKAAGSFNEKFDGGS